MNLSSSPADYAEVNTVDSKNNYRIFAGTINPQGWFLLSA